MANESIIKAAGQAYAPNPGQYDLSGFIQGITAVASGLVKRQQEVAKRGKQADELYLSSDNSVVQGIVSNLQDQVRSGTLTQNKAKQKLADLDRNYNKDLPQIELMVKDIFKKGVSRSAGELEENYLLGLSLGELDNPIVINGEQFSTFYSIDPLTNSLTILSPNGEYVSPRELKSIISNTPTIDDRNEGNKVTATFLAKPYKDGDFSTFPAASNAFKNGMKSVFENKRKRDSWLLDNPQGFEITNNVGEVKKRNFSEFYLQNGLDEKQQEVFKSELEQIKDKDVSDKTKLMIIKKLMESDPNIDADIDMFLDKFVADKTPRKSTYKPIKNLETTHGFTINGKLTKSEQQDLVVVDTIERGIEDARADKTAWKEGRSIKLMDGTVLLTPDPNKEGYFYFEKNMKGETEEDELGNIVPVKGARYSAAFPLHNQTPEGYKTLMLDVLREVPGGLNFGSTVYNNYKTFLNAN
jgi:hypothetical protein